MIQAATFNHRATGKASTQSQHTMHNAVIWSYSAFIAKDFKIEAASAVLLWGDKTVSLLAATLFIAGSAEKSFVSSNEDKCSHGINIRPMPCKTFVHPCCAVLCSAVQCIHPA